MARACPTIGSDRGKRDLFLFVELNRWRGGANAETIEFGLEPDPGRVDGGDLAGRKFHDVR